MARNCRSLASLGMTFASLGMTFASLGIPFASLGMTFASLGLTLPALGMTLLLAARPGADQPVAQGERVLGFLVAPVGVEPRPTLAVAKARQVSSHVIGQVQLDGAERLDD